MATYNVMPFNIHHVVLIYQNTETIVGVPITGSVNDWLEHRATKYGIKRFIDPVAYDSMLDPLAWQQPPQPGDAILLKCEPLKTQPLVVAWAVAE